MNLTILLQTLMFFGLPLLIGRAFVCLFKREKKEVALVSSYVLGGLSIFGFALSLKYLFGLVGTDFTTWFFGGVWFMAVLASIVNILNKPLFKVKELLSISALSVIALGVYSLWTWQNPYPLNWDFYQHQQLSRLIQQGEISYFTSEMSDTFGFNSYPPLFHSLMAVIQYPMDLKPEYILEFWQVITFWHILAVGVAAYYLTSAITNKRVAALFAGLMSMLTFDSHLSLTTFFLMPQTLTAVIFTLLLARLLKKGSEIAWWELAVGSLGLVLMHYMIGTVGAVAFLSLGIFMKLKKRFAFLELNLPISIIAFILISSLGFVLGKLPLSDLNHGEGKLYSLDFFEIKETIERSFGYLLYLLIPAGLTWLWTSKTNRETKILVSLLTYAFGVLVFSGMPYALKFMSLWRFWLVSLASIGLYGLFEKLNSTLSKAFLSLMFTFGLVTILIVNLMSFRSGIMADGVYTHLAEEDIEAATWLGNNYGKNAVIVSDPSTQFILEGLSGIDSLSGAYMPLKKREILWPAFYSRNVDKIAQAANSLTNSDNNNVKLLAISGRSMAWGRANDEQWQSFGYNVWSPIVFSIEDNKLIKQMSDSGKAILVFRNESIAIWELKNEK